MGGRGGIAWGEGRQREVGVLERGLGIAWMGGGRGARGRGVGGKMIIWRGTGGLRRLAARTVHPSLPHASNTFTGSQKLANDYCEDWARRDLGGGSGCLAKGIVGGGG